MFTVRQHGEDNEIRQSRAGPQWPVRRTQSHRHKKLRRWNNGEAVRPCTCRWNRSLSTKGSQTYGQSQDPQEVQDKAFRQGKFNCLNICGSGGPIK